MKNLVIVLLGIIIGISFTNAYWAWDNKTGSYSGSMQVLEEQGAIYINKEAIQYEPYDTTFSIEELNALAKIGTLKDGMYIITPLQ